MEDDNLDSKGQSESGPSSRPASPPAANGQAPPTPPPQQVQPASQSQPDPTASLFRGSSSPNPSRNSRSSPPLTPRRGAKRNSPAFSPVPEEAPAPPPKAEEPPTKKPRPARPDRSQRMFSLLTGTLSQFKKESESDRAAKVAERRASIEARLASKLKSSEQLLEQSERRRKLVWEARSVAEEIAGGDASRKTLRGLKRRQASFLFTPFHPPRHNKLAGEIPTAQRRGRGREEEEGAVYFLPGKTLPEQEDKLNEQEDKVDDQIDRFDDDWEEKRRQLMGRLEDIKGAIRELKA